MYLSNYIFTPSNSLLCSFRPLLYFSLLILCVVFVTHPYLRDSKLFISFYTSFYFSVYINFHFFLDIL
jgi:hypothetical protein